MILEKYNVELCAFPAQHGAYVVARNFAAWDWVETSTALPEASGANYLVGQHEDDYPNTCKFYGGAFRDRNGSVFNRQPTRWAYLRMAEEIWDGAKWVMPDGTAPPPPDPATAVVPKALQDAVDAIRKNWSNGLMLVAMDRSPFDVPEEGAPLE